MGISMKELLTYGTKLSEIPDEHCANLNELHDKLNLLRAAYGKPMVVTSGYRPLKEHLRIYKDKKGKIPMGSTHLNGTGCDFAAPNNGALKVWILANLDVCETIGLWFEDFDASPKHLHVQIVPPKSGKRFFKP